MFEASVKARKFNRGQTIEGTIVGLGPKVAFVDVGGKGEAEIDVAELKDANGNIEVAVGDRIQAVVVSTGGGIVSSRMHSARVSQWKAKSYRPSKAGTRSASPASARSVRSRKSTSPARQIQ